MQIKKYNNKKVSDSQKTAAIFQAILASESEVDRDKEHFWVMGIDMDLRVKFIELVSMGTAKASLVRPAEVFRLSVMLGAITIIVAHNHPSNSLEISNNDTGMTERLVKAGHILDIEVLDHLIVTKDSYKSIRSDKDYLFTN